MGSKIYVGGLPYSATEQQLSDLFSPHGSVQSARVITDKFTGQSRGFGFVEIGSEEEAKKAVIDYVLSRNMMTICGESFSFATPEPTGLHKCEVCMDFQRRAMCRTAFSTDVSTATLTARDMACDFLVHSTAEEIACSHTPPARVTCSRWTRRGRRTHPRARAPGRRWR